MSMLFNATPSEVKFLMVDPKMVELAPFNGLPHLLCPVVTEAKKVSSALNWVVREMEERYQLLAKEGVRNIEYYNQKKHEEASVAYAELVSAYPESEYVKPALFNLALCYKTIGDSDKAEAAYRKYYSLTGKSDDSLGALWEIFTIQKTRGNLSGAIKTLTQIYGEAEGREDGMEAMFRMGEISSDNHQTEEARDYWERLSKLEPASSAWRLQGMVKLAELYESEKNYGEAARAYEDISRNSQKPEFSAAAAERARALRAMGKPSSGKAINPSELPGMAGSEAEGDMDAEPSEQIEEKPKPAPAVKKAPAGKTPAKKAVKGTKTR